MFSPLRFWKLLKCSKKQEGNFPLFSFNKFSHGFLCVFKDDKKEGEKTGRFLYKFFNDLRVKNRMIVQKWEFWALLRCDIEEMFTCI